MSSREGWAVAAMEGQTIAEKREHGWFYRGEVAGFLGISTTLVDRDIRPNLPPGAEKMVGRRPMFYGPSVHELRIKQRLSGDRPLPSPVGTESDPMLDTDENSPAIERYRDEKAKIARIQRLEMEKRLMDRSLVREAHGRMAAVLRQAGDRLQRQFGQAALSVLDDALADWERQEMAAFGEGE